VVKTSCCSLRRARTGAAGHRSQRKPGKQVRASKYLTIVLPASLRLHHEARTFSDLSIRRQGILARRLQQVYHRQSQIIVVSISVSCLSHSGGRQCGQAIGCRTMQTRMTRSAGSRSQAVSWFGRRARWFCLRFFCSPYGAVTYLALLQCFSSRCARFACAPRSSGRG
jgi:hypothetical protein